VRLPAFLLVVFAVKLIVAFQLDQHPLLAPDSGLDTAAHLALARRVLGGDVLLGPGLYYMSPLYTYFLAGALFLRDSVMFVRAVQAALGTIAVGCVTVMATQWFGARAGWIAGIIAAVTGEFTFYEILILQSSLDTCLTAAALLLLTFALTRGTAVRYGAASGLVFGLSVLNRPNMGIALTIVVVVIAASRRWRLAAAISVGVICCLAPVVARNAIVSHELAVLSSQGGLNFYIGNHSAATGQYVPVPGVRSNIEGQSEDTQGVASQALGHPVTDAEASSYFAERAFGWMRSEPSAAARLFVKKVLLVFNWRHQWLDYSYPYYAHDLDSLLRVLVFGPWLILPLGLAGLFVLTGTAGPKPFGVWAMFVPAYAIAVAVFFVAERYRLPLLIALCVPAGALVDRMLALGQVAARQAVFAAAGVAGACVVAFWPFHLETGQFEERLRLSKVLMNRGDFDGAERELDAAHALRPRDLVTEFNFGVALVSAGRTAEGIESMRHAVEGGVEVPGARYALAGAIMKTGDRAGAAALIHDFAPDPGDDADSCYHVALLAVDAREFGVARRFLARALQLRPGWPEAERTLARIQSE